MPLKWGGGTYTKILQQEGEKCKQKEKRAEKIEKGDSSKARGKMKPHRGRQPHLLRWML